MCSIQQLFRFTQETCLLPACTLGAYVVQVHNIAHGFKTWPESLAGIGQLVRQTHKHLTANHRASLPARAAETAEALRYLLNVMCLRTAPTNISTRRSCTIICRTPVLFLLLSFTVTCAMVQPCTSCVQRC